VADILVYSEKVATARELLAKGRELAAALGLGVSAAALGPDASVVAAELGAAGADRVFMSEDPSLAGLPVDVLAGALAQIASAADARLVLIGSTRRGKELAPRLAQKLKAGCVTDVISMTSEDGALVAGRYAFGGATVCQEKLTTEIKVFAVMPKTFSAEGAVAGAGTVVPVDVEASSRVRVLALRPKEGDVVNLDAAPRIVGAGRGFSKREDLTLANQLAEALGAVVGCSKSLADFQWLGEDRIIGLSGAKTAPDLYVALGISGQIQHTVGIKGARLIAAVNKDKEAPIFQLADYGIVGDLYQVVPALVERLGRA
jgi:electron transfer flavoprotein alpha subunit